MHDPVTGEEIFRQLSIRAPIGIFVTGPDGRCHFTNDRWQLIAGLSAEEALGAGWTAAIHPDDRETVFREWARSVAEEREFDLNYRFQAPSGHVTHVHSKASAVRSPDGAVTAFVGTVEDVTARKLAEDQLRDREAWLHAIVTSSAEGICVIGNDNRITFTNPAMEHMLGFGPGEMSGLPLAEITHHAFQKPRIPGNQRWRAGAIELIRFCYRKKNGAPLWAQLSLSQLRNGSGTLIGGMALVTDLTHQLEVEEERDRIFTFSVDMLAVLGAGSRFIRVNPAWEATLGYSTAELLGRSVYELVHPDDNDVVQGVREQLACGEAVHSARVRLRARDGSYRWLSWNIAKSGEDQRLYCVAREVSALVAAQEEREQFLEALQSTAMALEEQAVELDRLRIEAEYLANHDVLTGVLNRRAWFAAAVNLRPKSVAIVDIDNFKRVNDTYGHPTGDVVLKEVAERIAVAVGADGVVGRVGGEEFAVLLTCPERAAAMVCQSVLRAVADTQIPLGAGEINVTVSIGLSGWAGQTASREEGLALTFAAADEALYKAKNSGRDRVVSALSSRAA